MQLEAFHFLLTPDGQQLLGELGGAPLTPESHLRWASRLRKEVGPERTGALLDTVLLRQQAAAKFSRAQAMYFTRTALEQASAEIISTYRAARYARARFRWVADLGCGIGGDALALAAHCRVIGLERRPLRLLMARHNVMAHDRGHRFFPVLADLLSLPALSVEALFADPSRRDERGRRIHSVHAYGPPLGYLDSWRERVPDQGIKISPGVKYEELPPEAEVEFISVDGEVREAVLWYGRLRTAANRRATLLPGPFTMTDADEPGSAGPVRPPGRYLLEPDGAVIRAHLVQGLGRKLNAARIDEHIAYLTVDAPCETPFARCYPVEDVFGFQLKRLRSYLRQRSVGQLTIKKRGSALDPDRLRVQLRLQGDESRTIFLTRVLGEPSVIVTPGPLV
jgi:hypothetical protein